MRTATHSKWSLNVRIKYQTDTGGRGNTPLEKKIAIRPTSETVMYPYYAKWIRSHRDLPLRLNQWNSVVRWEFKHPQPFLRTREFLWQEGHTAHLTKEDAGEEVLQILDWYAAIYNDLLAVPVIKGQKTEKEKFAGGLYTTTVEGYISTTGRGIQGGTSHCLGQNFSRMFGITVEDPSAKEGEKKPPLHVWQNSWGLSTRVIGVMVMVHGDNRGLVIPPAVAEIQVVIVPVGITAKSTDAERTSLYEESDKLAERLRKADIRVETDQREGYSPGWKFNDWELKGVPLRLEVGPGEIEGQFVTTSRRDIAGKDGKGKIAIEKLDEEVPALLKTIQADLYSRADEKFKSHRKLITDWDDFVPALNSKNVCLIPHCLTEECEDEIKDLSARKDDDAPEDAKAPSMGAKSLCIPFDQPDGITEETKCTNPKCSNKAKKWCMFGSKFLRAVVWEEVCLGISLFFPLQMLIQFVLQEVIDWASGSPSGEGRDKNKANGQDYCTQHIRYGVCCLLVSCMLSCGICIHSKTQEASTIHLPSTLLEHRHAVFIHMHRVLVHTCSMHSSKIPTPCLKF